MNNIKNIERLLDEISGINKKYSEIANITGENFNVFNILGMTANEVYCHSAFIKELLDPKGSHGQGDLFLKLFLEVFSIKDFETNNAVVEKEKDYGPIKEMEGGRIDLIIYNNNTNIIIENKIYAPDQENQLLRYYNNGKKDGDKSIILFYLTLFGNEPSKTEKETLKNEKFSPFNKDVNYNEDDDKRIILISYKYDILQWIEKCLKEATKLPLLRETLNQYIYLIKYLTGNAMSNKQQNEIGEKLAAKSENIESAFSISNNIDKMKYFLIKKLIDEIYKIVKNEFGDDINKVIVNNGNDEIVINEQDDSWVEQLRQVDSGFYFYKDGWNCAVGFGFLHKGFNYFYCGIRFIEGELDDKTIENIKKHNTTMQEEKEFDKYWPVYVEIDDRNWELDPDPWIKISNREMINKIEEKIKAIKDIFDKIDLR